MLDKILAILDGIDRSETESPDGWWETSTGVEFGRERVALIKKLFHDEPKTNLEKFIALYGEVGIEIIPEDVSNNCLGDDFRGLVLWFDENGIPNPGIEYKEPGGERNIAICFDYNGRFIKQVVYVE